MATASISGSQPIQQAGPAPASGSLPSAQTVLRQRADQTLGARSDGSFPPIASITSHAEDADGATDVKTNLGSKLKYDRNTTNNGKINDPLTDAQRKDPNFIQGLDADLKSKFPGGVSFNPAPTDPAAAADLKHAIASDVIDPEPGSEQGRCVDLNGKKTLVKADIDKTGKATVTVIGEGKPEVSKTAQFKSAEEAKQALESKFGVKVVNSNGKTWTQDQMQSAYAAFDKLSPEERKALKDVELKRVDGFPVKDRVAQFNGEVTAGPPATYKKSIEVADAAFASDKNQFIGDGSEGNRNPPSVQTLVHEAGHAVEDEEGNSKLLGYNQANNAYNKVIEDGGDYSKNHKAYFDQTGGKPLEAPALKVNQAIVDTDKKTQALYNAKTPAAVTAARTALALSVKNRDAALAKLPSTDLSSQAAHDYATSQNELGTVSGDLAQAKIASNQANTTHHHGPDAEHPDPAGYDTYTAKRVEAFDAFVSKNGIKAPTDYGATGGLENYAESFSLYKTNPAYMKENEPKLYAYFAAQEQKTAF